MDINFDDIDLGFAVNIRTLREVLAGISINGRTWWIASDPADAMERGYIAIGHGDPECQDRLNTLYYRAPVLSDQAPPGSTDRVVVLLEAGAISAEQPGLYSAGGRVLEDPLEDMECFWLPIRRAMALRLLDE